MSFFRTQFDGGAVPLVNGSIVNVYGCVRIVGTDVDPFFSPSKERTGADSKAECACHGYSETCVYSFHGVMK